MKGFIMSIDKTLKNTCEVDFTQECDAVELIIKPKEKDLGGFYVRRLLPFYKKRAVGPWVFFDQIGPAHFKAGKGINVRPHPHINLATVTYLFEGEILHRDSLGSVQSIFPGDVNLMVAGKGIVHSEREKAETNETDHSLHGLQLWLALPESDQEVDPEFHHYASQNIPTDIINDVQIRVIIGSAFGMSSPVKTFSETLYVEAHFKKGQSITLPDAEERAVYVATGKVRAKHTMIDTFELAVLEPKKGIKIIAEVDSQIAIIGGANLGPRYMEWNFVSTSKERIEQAKKEWKDGKFPKVPGDEKEFIPYP